MNLAQEAFSRLFPEKDINKYKFELKYSKKFKGYNASMRYVARNYNFNLSKKWQNIDKEIVIGLLQTLMLKISRSKKETINTQLYETFMKKVHISIEKKHFHPILEESFNRVNKKYFYGLIEKPNLKLNNSLTRIGTYDFGSDTITISKYLLEDKEILDYVMYHEMLHKFHKFELKNGKNYYHTPAFRKKEKEFENSKEIEKRLNKLISEKIKERKAKLYKKYLFFKER